MQDMQMKRILEVTEAPGRHWVGDGFPVHGMFGYDGPGVPGRSPFLMLDYAAPTTFEPTTRRRGVGQHPHRGFETVTIVYDGEVEHRDSTGKGGVIGRGDVQWMTAGQGILHEEFHSTEYGKRGGPFEMVQLWVNLPKKDKMAAPGYQGIVDADIPAVALPNDAGKLRVIAGDYDGHRGPAHTFSPMNVWDVRLSAGKSVELPQSEGWSTLLVVLAGTVMVNGETVLRERKIQGHDSNRRPDVQIVDEEGKARKVSEAERRPESSRNQKREAEYERLKLGQETHKVGGHKK